MTNLEMISLFLASMSLPSGASVMLSTRHRDDRFGASEGVRAVGGRDDDTLGERDNGRVCKGMAWFPDALTDRRCFRLGRVSSVLNATAAATPSPPFRRAFLRRSAASSNVSLTVLRFRTGGSLMTSAWVNTGPGRKTASASAPSACGDPGGVGSVV